MRDYGNHIIPNAATLPASGVAGQKVCVAGTHYYWHATYGQWLQMDDWFETYLSAAYSNATTTATTIFSLPVVANGIYEIEWKFQWQVSAMIGFKLGITVPSGTFNAYGAISAVASGTTAPTFIELNTSAAAQSGPTANLSATNCFAYGGGIVFAGTTAGSVAVQAAVSAAGTLTIAKGGVMKARRVG